MMKPRIVVDSTPARSGRAPAHRASRAARAWRAVRHEGLKHAGLVLLLVLTFYPFAAMFLISGKNFNQFISQTWLPTFPWHWSNYSDAWAVMGSYIFNTILVAGTTCVCVLVLSTLSAYAFARYRFPGKEIIYYLIISLLMVPGILTLIPQFILVKDLGLLNTRWVLILPYVAWGQVFGIFLLRGFFASIPEELFEAARIDGAGDLTMLRHMVLPLSWSILGTLAIFNVLGTWNDLIWPAVTIDDNGLKTIMIGIMSFNQQFSVNYGALMAGYVLASLPLVVLFAVTSRYFVAGLTSGALKM